MSSGVDSTGGGDIRLPKEDDDHLAHTPRHSPRRRRLLSFRHLNALAVLAVLAASGMVPATDLTFVLFSFVYLLLLSATAFPPLGPPGAAADPPVFGARNRLLAAYVSVGAVVGLLLPVAYILDGVLAGDKEGIRAAAPHLFLLAAQVFLEGVTFSWRFSLPMRAFVPIFYNTKRLFTIVDWLASEFGKAEGEHGAARRLLAGRALAVANLAFWAFNLFGFLLPVYLPRALKGYYCGNSSNNNNTKVKD
ncbi:hypothetical protein GW17_00026541 [Ensete ventricosum]|nr:hypothetical protein GW17_00026541 [Ensete ventricosum]